MREHRGRPPSRVVTVLAVTTLAVAAVAAAVARRRRGVPAAGSTAGSTAGGPDAAESLEACLREVAEQAPGQAVRQQVERLLAGGPGRVELVAACIDHRDRLAVRHPSLAERLRAVLGAVGVEEVVADGEPFDPQRHRSVDVERVDDPDLHDRVAQTCRPGYRDGTSVLRPPEVVVYVYPPRSAPGGTGVASQ